MQLPYLRAIGASRQRMAGQADSEKYVVLVNA
jgi:hypothetical protein